MGYLGRRRCWLSGKVESPADFGIQLFAWRVRKFAVGVVAVEDIFCRLTEGICIGGKRNVRITLDFHTCLVHPSGGDLLLAVKPYIRVIAAGSDQVNRITRNEVVRARCRGVLVKWGVTIDMQHEMLFRLSRDSRWRYGALARCNPVGIAFGLFRLGRQWPNGGECKKRNEWY
ncbi:hypothetical protein HY57_01290 [Dyella japonica A8]|uniref:Uncharacterized protein n=1 Tax=Dyella japonica A8 TaxID=1217721 RepID=A0A075JVN9_9GAMM|nr:hypothetical protein HY57_01290 [Dyella japonica A8]